MGGSQQVIELKVAGLYTNPSQFSEVPDGASNVADNVVLDRESIMQTRRGFIRYGNSLGLNTVVKEIMQYANDLIIHDNNGTLYYDSDQAGTWVAYPGTYSSPSTTPGSRIRSAESNKNFYFLTSNGCYKLDTLTNTPQPAGAPKGLGGVGETTGATGFMSPQTNVAYRIVWGYIDANFNEILGAPSERIIVSNNTTAPILNVEILDEGFGYTTGSYNNVALVGGTGTGATADISVTDGVVFAVSIVNEGTGYLIGDNLTASIAGGSGFSCQVAALDGGTANVQLTFQIPHGLITTSWFYQVYRSLESVNLSTPPDDELQQCYENNPTAAQLTGELITITDSTPDELLQASLYTDQSQDPNGINIANWQPPFAQDITVYKGYTFYANTRTLQGLNVTLVSSEPPLGLQIGDTVTFTDNSTGTSFELTGGTTENQTTGVFEIYNTNDPAIDIQNTAQSLIKIANLYTANTFLNAYYMSDFNDLPGQMLFQKLDLTPETFYINSSRSTAWATPIPSTGSNNQTTSTNDNLPNRLFFSQFNQPEAVPLINFLDVGSANQPIQRIIALRDGLIILKKDGVFRLYGLTAPFTLAPLDNTVTILANNTAVLLNNQVFFLSDQGVVAASDNGVQILSRPIETTLLQLTSPDLFPNFSDIAFAVTYQSDRKYILGMQTTGTDTDATQQYVYNYITNAWTRWTREMTCGLINIRDDKFYFGGPADPTLGGFVYVERKTYTNSDYADEQFTANITGSTFNVVNVDSTANINVNDTIEQTSNQIANVTQIVNPTTIIVDNVIGWTEGPVTIYTPITSVIETIQLDCKNPGIMKHIRDISFIFSDANFNDIDVLYTTDTSQSSFENTIKTNSSASWGFFNWGGQPWGGILGGKKRLRTLIPRGAQRANWITINITNSQPFTSFSFSGYSIVYSTMTERMGGNNAGT